jgi:methylated-DNA-protein-cysteine methyltransferase-like protein
MKKKTSFFEQVYALVKTIPVSKVTTYGEIAKALGSKDARKVGWALHKNPYEHQVPCHRVVNKQGGLAPNFAFDGPEEQRRRLKQEKITFTDQDRVDLKKHLWQFSHQ